jgi:hypothetical protein
MAGKARANNLNDNVSAKQNKSAIISEEQLVYSKLLGACMKVGLVAIVLSFTIYMAGIMPPKLDINDVVGSWGDTQIAAATADVAGKPSASNTGKSENKTAYELLLEENGVHHGWDWARLFGYGDFLNMFPIAFLASITIFCYIAIVPIFLRKKDTIYTTLAIIEVVILIGAASGIISGGH